METWKDIIDYEGLYQVSNLARVKSLSIRRQRVKVLKNTRAIRPRKERILKQPLSNGYPIVMLSKNNKKVSRYVHRLVAQAFIPAIQDKHFVNHKDGTRNNNSIDNLEWVTHKENVQHYWKPTPLSEEVKKRLQEIAISRKATNFAF